ncbi:MAG: sigma-70 family polymerase sigma factor [Gammaproteobacteria bacterium]|jgi:RNA polymerase sigma factor (sigma-70 family)|nr:sigma-70 family polymerase sigma factor [Gammaproteobacteria bacterium]
MDAALNADLTSSAQDREIDATVRRERGRLLAFIRRRVLDAAEAEDVLQEALYELVAAYRLMQPVEQAGAWLMRVARNRIIDRFRKKKPELLADQGVEFDEDEDVGGLEDLLPSPDDGPDAVAIRQLMLERIEAALDELPPEQRDVFIAQELEGASFKELAARWNVTVSALLSRKRYAVLYLRKRLQAAYDEWLED